MGVPIDIVVGTSMGAVIGGLYASGYTPAEIKQITNNLDWERILTNRENRKYTYFRRKRDDDLFLINNILGYRNGELLWPTGIVQGQQLYQSFKKLTLRKVHTQDFSKLPIPFAAVCTDITYGERVVLTEGDLALAMLASMSVPGLFSPVEIEGKLLVDGGLVNNVPVEVAKEMGADILIVVDIGSPLLERHELKNFKAVLSQVTNLYVHKNVEKSLSKLTDQDILIQPDLEGIATTENYEYILKGILPGKCAALKKQKKLNRLVGFGKQPTFPLPDNQVLCLKGVHVDNTTRLCTKTYYDYLPITPGPYTLGELDEFISRLYGLEMFDSIHYHIEDSALVVEPIEKSWGPTYIQGSFLLVTDFEGQSGFTMSFGITRTLLNPLAGEWRLFGQIGEINGVFAEFYQPQFHFSPFTKISA